MSDPEVPAAEAAPETVVTATPPSEVATPEATPAEPPKTFTQEELDAIIGKRLAKEQRKWERDAAKRSAVAQPQPVDAPAPKVEQFETPEAYAEALAERKVAEKFARIEQERQAAEVAEAFAEKSEQAREKYDDFDEVVQNPTLRITQEMAEVIRASDIGPELAYHLGTNPKEAERISRLNPFLQAKEIGRLEAKLAANPPTKKTSSAPAPIAPVKARGGSEKSFDTTDPRSITAMTTSEWIAAERERQIKKMQGR